MRRRGVNNTDTGNFSAPKLTDFLEPKLTAMYSLTDFVGPKFSVSSSLDIVEISDREVIVKPL
ncbi:hypothetical protein A6R68_21270 [Neotoma lepida]|uniref:Uncharacterized protein n=1 Tax=Neotoma lepida TaxID=56216 RepID=A0A1A6HQM5_NEOLE|nr:hypothetical protein A6R68_21270 [Neotoma lepida]